MMGAGNDDLKNSSRKRLQDMSDDLEDFDKLNMDDFMFDKDDMPKGDLPPGVNKFTPKDHVKIMKDMTEIAEKTIKFLANNYLPQQDVNNLSEKTLNAINYQTSMLADVEYMINECKEMMVLARDYIDSGDVSQQMFSTHRGYVTDMNTHMQAKHKMMLSFEDYWKKIGNDVGMEKTEESMGVEKKTPSKKKTQDDTDQEEDVDETTLVMTAEKVLKIFEDDKKKKKSEENVR